MVKLMNSFSMNTYLLRCLSQLTSLLVVCGAALTLLQPAIAHADDNFLEPEIAFQFSARMADAKTIEVQYNIADGYYMYRERFQFRAEGARLSAPKMPDGIIKFDDTFQKNVETYHHRVAIRIPVDANAPFVLIATSQGCADQGLCYAPMDSRINLTPDASSAPQSSSATSSGSVTPMSSTPVPALTTTSGTSSAPPSGLEASLKGGNLLIIVPLFALLGLGLAFTPCVLPMVPILSFIILGEGPQVRRGRAFLLSAMYSLGMAIVYTALGVAAGLIGEGLSASLQNPWILSAFAALMVAFSLSMFGVYQMQMPAFIQARLVSASEKQKAGKLIGVFVMGALSALIIGPCVAAPLAAALVYISQTHDVVIGGSALFAMAAGMSIPLLLIGISAGSLLPRAGAWMDTLKRFFGVLMLGLALWMISPLLSVRMQMLGWAILGLGYGGYLIFDKHSALRSKIAGVLFLGLGAVQLLGATSGGNDVLAPLSHFTMTSKSLIVFERVKSSAELDRVLTHADGKISMLDFYADWCVSCKEMERFTFSDPRVQKRLAKLQLLQADVTGNNEDDKTLLKRFKLFGPPGIIFFDVAGNEIPGTRVIGYQNAEKFLASLGSAGL